MEAKSKKFFESLDKGPKELLQMIDAHRSRSQNFDLNELIQFIPSKDHQRLWKAFYTHLNTSLQKTFCKPPPVNEEMEDDFQDIAQWKESVLLIRCGILLLQIYLKDSSSSSSSSSSSTSSISRKSANSKPIPEPMVQSICLIHELILPIHQLIAGGEALEEEEEAKEEGEEEEEQGNPETLNFVSVLSRFSRGLDDEIARVCEHWWIQDRRGKDALVPQTISYLFFRALSPKAKAADIKRLYAFRGALLALDFHDDSASFLKDLMLRCILESTTVGTAGTAPEKKDKKNNKEKKEEGDDEEEEEEEEGEASSVSLFIRVSEGKRFLSYLFGLFPPFIDELHLAIKAQITNVSNVHTPGSSPFPPSVSAAAARTRKVLLDSLGEVYFKAWKVATGPYLLKLEYGCIQDIMASCVYGVDDQIVTSLRRILSYFHQQKKYRGVDEMLSRLYEPILWRSLKCANPKVRENAAVLMIDAFPLVNDSNSPGGGTGGGLASLDQPLENTSSSSASGLLSDSMEDNLLQRQFDHLAELLLDPSVGVRCVAVRGVCRVLGVYWEMIPSPVIKSLLAAILRRHAFDQSSAVVRVAVFEGLTFLLDNHLSQPTLKPVLPTLSLLIHDKSEKVRVAFLELLGAVKRARLLRYYDVVSMPHLLQRLAEDYSKPHIARRITSLIINSYFPHDKLPAPEEGGDKEIEKQQQKELDKVLVERCVLLAQENLLAAVGFFTCVSDGVMAPPSAPARLLLLLLRTVKQCLTRRNRIQTQRKRAPTPEETNEEEEDAKMIDAILAVMSAIWKSLLQGPLSSRRRENKKIRTALMKKFGEAGLSQLLTLSVETSFNPHRIRHILEMAQLLSPEESSTILNTVLPLLRNVASKIASVAPEIIPPSSSRVSVASTFSPSLSFTSDLSCKISPEDVPSHYFLPFFKTLYAWNKQNQALQIVADWIAFPFIDEEARRNYLDLEEKEKELEEEEEEEEEPEEETGKGRKKAKKIRTEPQRKRPASKSSNSSISKKKKIGSESVPPQQQEERLLAPSAEFMASFGIRVFSKLLKDEELRSETLTSLATSNCVLPALQAYLQAIEQRTITFTQVESDGLPLEAALECEACLLPRVLLFSAYSILCKTAIHSAAEEEGKGDKLAVLKEFCGWVKEHLLPLDIVLRERLDPTSTLAGIVAQAKRNRRNKVAGATAAAEPALSPKVQEFILAERKFLGDMADLAVSAVTECNSCGLFKSEKEGEGKGEEEGEGETSITLLAAEILALVLENTDLAYRSAPSILKFAYRLLQEEKKKKATTEKEKEEKEEGDEQLISQSSGSPSHLTVALELLRMTFTKLTEPEQKKKFERDTRSLLALRAALQELIGLTGALTTDNNNKRKNNTLTSDDTTFSRVVDTTLESVLKSLPESDEFVADSLTKLEGLDPVSIALLESLLKFEKSTLLTLEKLGKMGTSLSKKNGKKVNTEEEDEFAEDDEKENVEDQEAQKQRVWKAVEVASIVADVLKEEEENSMAARVNMTQQQRTGTSSSSTGSSSRRRGSAVLSTFNATTDRKRNSLRNCLTTLRKAAEESRKTIDEDQDENDREDVLTVSRIREAIANVLISV